jgi:ATP-dependent DNA helicase MPH1
MVFCLLSKTISDYTWFPKGKVIFVAPTKPLVGQQVVACHQVCGIPGSEAVEMTGEIPVSVRERHVCCKHLV